ncbi:S8 family serine peptidase [Pontibacter vulgaris]|uniref:S8 family serine peptidase n=1 Tax=Pontibacter vulgaris TaxID=2905679 RepID=UPI001FA70729|nr:S8 family serine peptidase [Pontibacter vulgaris]
MEDQFKSTESSVSENVQTIPGQYIVVLKDGSNNLQTTGISNAVSENRASINGVRESVLEAVALDRHEVRETYEGAVNGFTARLSNEQVEKLRNNPEVAYVEQDKVIALGKLNMKSLFRKIYGNAPTPAPAPVDTVTQPVSTSPAPTLTTSTSGLAYTTITPLAGDLVPWNIAKVGYGNGTGKTVWVIDSGVDTDHPDLNINLTRSKSFIYGETSIEDGYGHGTTVAGIIAAKNNGTGMIGVASNATIIALRVFDNAGSGTVSRAISAVNYVIQNAKAGEVVNLSLGAGISTTLDNAVKTAAGKGILFAIAAGNSAVDCSGLSPARVNATNVYTISAIDNYNRLWDKSNYGLGVDFAAPGVNVTGTTKGGGLGYAGNGTSYAAPHVAGLLLLRGTVYSQGTITGDKDSKPDPIASIK